MTDEEKKPTYPVKVVVTTRDESGNEFCVQRKIIECSDSTYYFGAASLRDRVLKELIEAFRVEITLVFPGKDELG